MASSVPISGVHLIRLSTFPAGAKNKAEPHQLTSDIPLCSVHVWPEPLTVQQFPILNLLFGFHGWGVIVHLGGY